jgi:hypothetical protein
MGRPKDKSLQLRNKAKKQLTQMLRDVKTELNAKIDKAVRSGAVPDNWLKDGASDVLIAKIVIDHFCERRPYQLMSDLKKDAENIKKFI